MNMKKLYVILATSIAVAIGLFIFSKYLIVGKELEISFVTAQKYTLKNISDNGYLNRYEWFIISGEIQRNNLVEEGYIIPAIDFNKNYLIISKYKISKLYRTVGDDLCSGVPNGRVIFDKGNSNNNFYYFYLMPKIMLSQGVG